MEVGVTETEVGVTEAEVKADSEISVDNDVDSEARHRSLEVRVVVEEPVLDDW